MNKKHHLYYNLFMSEKNIIGFWGYPHPKLIDKYKKLGIKYRLEDISEPTAEQIKIAQNILLERRK